VSVHMCVEALLEDKQQFPAGLFVGVFHDAM
jgi:hypothetical protein